MDENEHLDLPLAALFRINIPCRLVLKTETEDRGGYLTEERTQAAMDDDDGIVQIEQLD